MDQRLATSSETGSWEGEVRSLEDEARLAFVARDTATLDRIWLDSFVVNSPLNVVSPKPVVLELLRTGRIGHVEYSATIEHIGRHGDLVVVMGGETIVDHVGEPAVQRRFSHVWRREGAGWRLLARHANNVAEAR